MAKISELDKESQHVKWGDIEVPLPAPSKQVGDFLWGVITGAIVALVGVAVGAVVSDHQT